MILSVCNVKGGVGKSTLAVQLALLRVIQGKKVWLIDGDTQGSTTQSIGNRAAEGVIPMVSCSAYDQGKMLIAQLKAQSSFYDDVIIDVGGKDSSVLRAALGVSDKALIPFAPSSLDLWALQQIDDLLGQVKDMGSSIEAVGILNQAEPSATSADNRDSIAYLSEYPNITALPLQVVKRKAFNNAMASGLSVLEHRPKDAKAIAEIEALANAVF